MAGHGWEHPREVGMGRVGGLRGSRESIRAGGDAGRFLLEIYCPVKKKMGLASWTECKGGCR